MINKESNKISILGCILTVLFVTAMLISNVLSARQVALPVDINLFGIPLNSMTGGTLVFPITYILSDLFSEVYGYRWSRISCYLAFAMNLLMVGLFTIVINSPAPVWFEMSKEYSMVLGQTPRILFASLLAFVGGDFINDNVFRIMKANHKTMEKFPIRAIGSSIAGECIDSLIFYPIAFFGVMSVPQMIGTAVLGIILKVGFEVIILPITIIITDTVYKYEKNIEKV